MCLAHLALSGRLTTATSLLLRVSSCCEGAAPSTRTASAHRLASSAETADSRRRSAAVPDAQAMICCRCGRTLLVARGMPRSCVAAAVLRRVSGCRARGAPLHAEDASTAPVHCRATGMSILLIIRHHEAGLVYCAQRKCTTVKSQFKRRTASAEPATSIRTWSGMYAQCTC